MSTTEPAEQQPTITSRQQMIEQINIALEAKRVRNFSAWVIEACRRFNVRKESIYIN